MASRSPHRPNNIGLTLAKVIKCDGDRLELAEVDLVDGTPVQRELTHVVALRSRAP